MHSALSKSESVLDLYLTFIANASEIQKDILVKNQSRFFIPLVQDYLTTFFDSLQHFEKISSEGGTSVVESVNGAACSSKDSYGMQLEEKLRNYNLVMQTGADPTAADVTKVIQAFQKFVKCYSEGVTWVLENLQFKKPA
jgi:hypothetical protein